MNEKPCAQWLGNLSDYVDGILPDAICEEIEGHMANCEDCRVVVDTLKMTVDLYQTMPQPEMPDTLREKLFKSIQLNDAQRPE